jgi:hypothetical protein
VLAERLISAAFAPMSTTVDAAGSNVIPVGAVRVRSVPAPNVALVLTATLAAGTVAWVTVTLFPLGSDAIGTALAPAPPLKNRSVTVAAPVYGARASTLSEVALLDNR